METGKCSELYHLHCLLKWIIFHNAYLLHYNGSHPLTRNMRTFHVTYPCPNCQEEGHLVTQPINTWTIKNWATKDTWTIKNCTTKDTLTTIKNWASKGNQTEDTFDHQRGLDQQPVFGISCARLSATTK